VTGVVDAGPATRGRRRWVAPVVVVVAFEAQAALAWTVPSVDRPLWLAPVLVACVGLLAVLALYFEADRLGGPTRGAARRWLPPSLVVLALTVFTGFVGWSLTLPAKISGDPAATRLAERLLARPATGCESNGRDLSTVGSLMSAEDVCVFAFGGHRFVEFGGATTSRGGLAGRGLLYLTFDPFREPRSLFGICLRHLEGQWWAYDQFGLGCSFGYSGIAGP